ncbi:MAG TPA: Smr/MutS family protein [Candidatus Eisenbacteria bacterium]|nr:Smr/MutS family protein [Candidatus Eisenbacteria bacterium]
MTDRHGIGDHATSALELPAVLGAIAGRARSQPGRERILDLAPHRRIDHAIAAQSIYADLMACADQGDAPPTVAPPDVRVELERLSREGAALRGDELWRLSVLLEQAAMVVTWHRKTRRETPGLDRMLAGVDPVEGLHRAITRALEPSGEVKDDASPELSRIRRRIRGLREKLATKLESILRSLATPESFVTLREGRYVVAIPSSNRRALPGTVLGHSGSGASLFVEPRDAADANSELSELGLDEAAEVDRILRDLSARAHTHRAALGADFEALVRLDAAQAVTAWTRDGDGSIPELTEERRMRLRGGRHPLLVERHRKGETGAPVPLDLELDPDTRMLLITGPNMGGKTVAMKTVGLLSLLAMAGLPIPAAAGSVMPWLDRVICDIGDEQSILADVSTFLSHLRRVTDAIEHATERSLVLLDELGSGTDPVEGAALAQAVLETLLQRGALTIATTHHGMLKTFAHDTPGVRNASMAFDEETLRPRFRIVVGIPGGSRAIQVAERYGMEPKVLDRARQLLPEGERDLNKLLEELSRLREEARTERAALERATLDLAARESELREMRDRLESERRERKQAELAARKDLLRQLENQIDDYRKKLRADKKATPERLREARDLAKEMEAEIERETPRQAPVVRGEPVRQVAVGDRVYVPSLQADAEVLTDPDSDGRVRVRIGGVTAMLPLAQLRRAEGAAGPSAAGATAAGPATPRKHAVGVEPMESRSEIDVRGLETDEAIRAAERFLEDAVMAGLPTARIIHGKGKGILRERMKHWLSKNSLVKEFRLGEIREGGTGVTVVTLG